MLGRGTPARTEAAPQKGTDAVVPQQKAGFSLGAPFSSQTWAVHTVCLARDLTVHLCKQHLPTRGSDKACEGLTALQESWVPDSLGAGFRAATATMHCPVLVKEDDSCLQYRFK